MLCAHFSAWSSAVLISRLRPGHSEQASHPFSGVQSARLMNVAEDTGRIQLYVQGTATPPGSSSKKQVTSGQAVFTTIKAGSPEPQQPVRSFEVYPEEESFYIFRTKAMKAQSVPRNREPLSTHIWPRAYDGVGNTFRRKSRNAGGRRVRFP